ncbi:hypothetical protein TMatcc_006038 [Talaromyces marneffei ATCC 18224]|uniref:Uncharacterized protein n=1 Tax=Talaromyces marneffei (strain ATCC 18224 / CBS 334.59 / QM 7333) TaxID=441960 RepID=B6QCS6_TALMQ|nr:uncharacterized protein EYB26_002983 [Talaromyces marneffei]EEA25730.1 conserved hypothetical protein [Talaromyces marneffei ATCC 18224]KAE8554429.1 hypothetical protein EYB25_002968 [Talaromyces marneffei]QGA15326.1 hypothetical protein EYB26_002983 [Talaromyces marneffei]
MPAPLAKGIIIGVSVLVAAGIAIYESPQFRQWVNQSRRKVAIALYNLGDEIHPREARSEDISMVEETGEAAKERRRKAREEIEQRREFNQARRHRSTRSSSAAVSFDALVDEDGRLKSEDGEEDDTRGIIENGDHATAQSTALDTSNLTSLHKRGGSPGPEPLTNARLQAQHEMLEAMERDRLHLALPSETSSQHPSESIIDLTPTSEFPDTNHETTSNRGQIENSEYFSVANLSSSTHSSEIGQSEHFYTHPNQFSSSSNSSFPANPFVEHDVSTTSSIPGSLEHVHDELSSDGTLSEWGQPTDGILTPASWSEVGSVISSDDEHYHQP